MPQEQVGRAGSKALRTWVFWGGLDASALWLVVGIGPDWVDQVILFVLWALVVFVLSVMTLAGLVGLIMAAFGAWPDWDKPTIEAEAKPATPSRSFWSFDRFLRILFLGLLVIAGHLLLAGLYLGISLLVGIMAVLALSRGPGFDPADHGWSVRMIHRGVVLAGPILAELLRRLWLYLR